MKTIALASAIALSATTALAGSMAAPISEPIEVPVVVEEPSMSMGALAWLVPLVAVAVIGAAAANK